MKYALAFILAALLAIPGHAATDPAADELPEDLLQRGLARAWWNSKRTPDIGLTADQRTAMDAYLADYLQQNYRDKRTQSATMGELGDALRTLDSQAAHSAAAQMGEVVNSSVRRQVDMILGVLGVLTPEQRTSLESQNPELLQRFWFRSSVPKLVYPVASDGAGSKPQHTDKKNDGA